MRNSQILWALVPMLGWTLGCGGIDDEDIDPTTPEQEAELFDPYVDQVAGQNGGKALAGGQKEKEYAPVGFLKRKDGRFCAATLLKKDVAITAAHCVADIQSSPKEVKFHLGRKLKDSSLQRTIKEIRLHPKFALGEDYTKTVPQFDVALVFLKKTVKKVKIATASMALTQEQIPGMVPPPMPERRCDYRFIGYGGAESKESNGRRSAMLCMTTRHGTWQMAEVVDGYNCPGDSGGAVVRDKTLEVVAILSGVFPTAPGQPTKTCFKGTNASATSVTYPLDADPLFLTEVMTDSKSRGVTELGQLP